jgi:hypothetical protein
MDRETKEEKEQKALAHQARLNKMQRDFEALTYQEQQKVLKKRAKAKALRVKIQKRKLDKTSSNPSQDAVVEGKQEVDTPSPSTPTLVAPPFTPVHKSVVDQEEDSDDGFEEVSSKKARKEEEIHHNWSSTVPKASLAVITVDSQWDKSPCSMGNLDVLPYQLIVNIIGTLPLKTVANLSRTCRGLYRVTQDGTLWQSLFKKTYPYSQLTPQSMKDWKRLFALEVDQVLHSLVCFHTKVDFREDVLGFPMEFTVNPKTKEVDYIYSSMDIISRQAFFEDNVSSILII